MQNYLACVYLAEWVIQYFLESDTGEVDMVTEEQIRELAYAIWEQEGRPEGKDLEYYFRAKQMLEEQEAASSPAKESGPPASGLQPPSAQKPIARRTGKGRSKRH